MENAHVSQRGLFLIWLVEQSRASYYNKKKVPRFFMPTRQEISLIYRLWDLGNQRKKIIKNKLKVVPDTNQGIKSWQKNGLLKMKFVHI